MQQPREQADRALARLSALWRREQATARAQFAALRRETTLEQRVAAGVAVSKVDVEDTDAGAGGRLIVVLSAPFGGDLRFRSGQPVRLWWDDPESPEALSAVVGRPRGGRLTVVLDGDLPERFEEGAFHVDQDAPEATFRRGLRALDTARAADRRTPLARLVQVLFGGAEAGFRRPREWTPLDSELNAPQHAAVTRAISAEDVALVHGPPGTGKTRTLVEIIRQCVADGDSVLATAASNTAVDNLAERLVATGLDVVRLGHPARVSPAVEDRTLDALLETSGDRALVRQWSQEAAEIRRKIATRSARGRMDRAERRALYQEAGRLNRDARQYLRGLQDAIIARADVVCATAAGADAGVLGDTTFDTVVLDEATQASDPMALVAINRGRRVILAGDPCQLPPTVLDYEAAREGLGETCFERLAQEQADALRLLTVQHRMHEQLMGFPSESLYDGQLVAAPAVANHRLEDLGITPDPTRPGPLVFIDTAGKGWEEERTVDDPSTSNPGQAERTAAEVRRLLRRGLPATDLAVITPYDAQVRLLRRFLADERAAGLEIGSVDGFQGREKEAIVLDLVRSNSDAQLGFLGDRRRMNVALTRARRFLLVIGDSATLGGHAYYDGFMAFAERVGAWTSAWEDDPDEPF